MGFSLTSTNRFIFLVLIWCVQHNGNYRQVSVSSMLKGTWYCWSVSYLCWYISTIFLYMYMKHSYIYITSVTDREICSNVQTRPSLTWFLENKAHMFNSCVMLQIIWRSKNSLLPLSRSLRFWPLLKHAYLKKTALMKLFHSSLNTMSRNKVAKCMCQQLSFHFSFGHCLPWFF